MEHCYRGKTRHVMYLCCHMVICLVLTNIAVFVREERLGPRVCFLRGSLLGSSWTDESLQYVCSVLLALVQLECESLVWTIGYVLGVMLGKGWNQVWNTGIKQRSENSKSKKNANKFIHYSHSSSHNCVFLS